ncbi:alpha/beta-hydrolase [Clavulina sp. PMI_390]|nr:alpha/beta-hydrolase [Clavulina sp. PMI_390]
MAKSPFDVQVTGTLRRIYIPRTSWQSVFFWWRVRLRKLNIVARLRRSFLSAILSLVQILPVRKQPPPSELVTQTPIPPPEPWRLYAKGPQVWDFPPPVNFVNRLLEKGQERVFGQWKHETSGWTMITVSPPPTAGPARRTILYLYGSGFMNRITVWHWSFIGYLSRWLDAEVVAVPYPVGQDNPGHEWRSALLDIYREFIQRAGNKEVIIAGDSHIFSHPQNHGLSRSAGGMVCLGLMYELTKSSPPLVPPHQLIAICTSPDLSLPNRVRMLAIEPYDNSLKAESCNIGMRLYVGVDVPSSIVRAGAVHSIPIPSSIALDPCYSPMHGDPAVLRDAGTKLVIVNAEWDILFPDSDEYVNKLARAGVDVTYIVGQKQFHCFPVALDASPECRIAADLIVESVVRNGKAFHLQKETGRH